jgi:hypothetical protein
MPPRRRFAAMNVAYRRGQKSGLLPRGGNGNPAAFVTQSSRSTCNAVILNPEQAFRIMVELADPYRTEFAQGRATSETLDPGGSLAFWRLP